MAKEKILVVDDEKDILELLKYNLEKSGFNVICIKSGGHALDFIDEIPKTSIVILDIMLPGMNGLEILKILKKDEKTKNIPVIMLTAKGEEADIIEGLKLGADDYITKPFSLERIKEIVNRCNFKMVGA